MKTKHKIRNKLNTADRAGADSSERNNNFSVVIIKLPNVASE